MKILFIGDVVGENGIKLLRKAMPELKKKYTPVRIVINGENSAQTGRGITKQDSDWLFGIGAHVITGGNHSLRRCSIDLYEENEMILCPANLLCGEYSYGVANVDFGRESLCVINLIGTAFLEPNKSPFFAADEILKTVSTKNILVDFHAESTAEKQALANYLSGRVSAVIGTHTHIQTNDEQIINGTATITDAGAVMAQDSVLGIETHQAVQKQKTLAPIQFTVAQGGGYVCGVYIECESGRRTHIEKIREYIAL